MNDLFVVHVVNSKSKIIHVWVVRANDVQAAEGMLRALDWTKRKEGDEPIIPDGCYLTTEPLELENSVLQIT